MSLPASVFDFFPWPQADGSLAALYKNNALNQVERATAPALTGPWTVRNTGDWAGWIAGIAAQNNGAVPLMEGCHLFPTMDGKVGALFDVFTYEGSGDYRFASEWYSETADQTLASGWSTPVNLKTLPRHARVRRMPLDRASLLLRKRPQLILSRASSLLLTSAVTPIAWDTVHRDNDLMFNPSVAATGSTPAGDSFVTFRSGGRWGYSANLCALQGTGDRFLGLVFNEDYTFSDTDKDTAVNRDSHLSVAGEFEVKRGDRVMVTAQATGGDVFVGGQPRPKLVLSWLGS